MKKIQIDRKRLKDLYVNYKMTILEIAKEFNIGKSTVYRNLKDSKIPIRSVSESKRSKDWTGYCKDCGVLTLFTRCKSCSDKQNYNKNRDSYLEKCDSYRKRPENKKRMKEYNKDYKKKNPDKIKIIQEKYRKNNIQFFIRKRIRERLRIALLNQGLKKTQTSKKYGVDFTAIIKHLGPCPGLRSDWHIDHIIPLSYFDLKDKNQIRFAVRPENHQWLKAEENLVKGATITSLAKKILASMGDYNFGQV